MLGREVRVDKGVNKAITIEEYFIILMKAVDDLVTEKEKQLRGEQEGKIG